MDGTKLMYKVNYKFWLHNPRNDNLIEIETHAMINDREDALTTAHNDANLLINAKNRVDTPANQKFIEVAGFGCNIDDLVYFCIQISEQITYNLRALCTDTIETAKADEKVEPIC